MQVPAGLPNLPPQYLQLCASKGVPIRRAGLYHDPAVTSFVLPAESVLVRVGAAVALFFILAMCASGARVTIPGLREQTRMVLAPRVVRPPRTRRSANRAIYNGRKKLARLLRHVRAFSWPKNPWLVPVPALAAQRTPGQDGSMGVPRGHRWTVLGGAGRLGPGAGT